MSLKSQILAAAGSKLEPVEVPEWGVTVYVPVTTLGEAAELQKITSGDNSFPKLAAYIIREQDGSRVFTDADVVALEGVSLNAVKRCVDKYNTLNGNEEDAKN
jgi:hypothetical protein